LDRLRAGGQVNRCAVERAVGLEDDLVLIVEEGSAESALAES
jgi:hypothetical protein